MLQWYDVSTGQVVFALCSLCRRHVDASSVHCEATAPPTPAATPPNSHLLLKCLLGSLVRKTQHSVSVAQNSAQRLPAVRVQAKRQAAAEVEQAARVRQNGGVVLHKLSHNDSIPAKCMLAGKENSTG